MRDLERIAVPGRPRVGAWIEIVKALGKFIIPVRRPRVGAWIEIDIVPTSGRLSVSPPRGGVD